MNLPQPKPIQQVQCVECSATNVSTAERCWICGREIPVEPEMVDEALRTAYQSPLVSSIQEQAEGPAALITTVALLAVVILVGAGIAIEDPGVLIGYGIIVIPGFLGMLFAASRSRAKGLPLGVMGRILWFFASMAMVVGVISLVCIAAFVAFFVYCLVVGGFRV